MQVKPIKIVGISGSLKASSANKKILQFIASNVPTNVSFSLYEELAVLPQFNPDNDTPNANAFVENLRLIIKEADGIIFCTPEYAFGVPGALKNGLDWLVSSGEINEKPVAVIAASLGGEKALASLLLTLQALGTKMVSATNINFIGSKISKEGIIDADTTAQIENVITVFLTALNLDKII